MTARGRSPQFLADLRNEFVEIASNAESANRGRRSKRPIRTIVLACAATLVLAAAAAAATTGLLHSEPHGPHFAVPEAVGQFDPAIERDASVLQRPRTAADSMGRVAQNVAGDAAPGSSLRVTLPTPLGGTPHAIPLQADIWLLPTSTGAASLQVLPPGASGPSSGAAADAHMLEDGHAVMTESDAAGTDVIGMVPDNVRSVTVTCSDGTNAVLSVINNVYGAHFNISVRSVSFVTPNGPVSAAL